MSKAPAVDYALEIIEFFARENSEIGIADISNSLGINKNAVSRILDALLEQNWIYMSNCSQKKYCLTLRPFSLIAGHTNNNGIVKIAAPYLEELNKKLSDYKASLSSDEIKALIKKNEELKVYQSTLSTEEEIATLPKLKLEDINENPEDYNLEVISNKYDILLSDYHTNDIAYVKYYFDISHINNEEILFVSLFTETFKQLSTNNNTYQQINQFIQNNTGGMSAAIQSITTLNKEAKLYLSFSYSALTENVKPSNNLLVEIINETNFKDEKRLYERLCELKATLEMSVVNRGHQVALNRALSYINEANMNKENIIGISFIDFISEITNNFEASKAMIIKKLESVKEKFISKKNMILGFTGTKEQLNTLMPVFDDFYSNLSDDTKFKTIVFEHNVLNEGLKAQFDVNYVDQNDEYTSKFH